VYWSLQEVWIKKGREAASGILLELYPKAVLRKGYEGGSVAILDRLPAARCDRSDTCDVRCRSYGLRRAGRRQQ